MEVALALLDREIVHAAIFHELAAPTTAVHGLTEILEGEKGIGEAFVKASQRIFALSSMASTWKGPARPALLFGAPVVVNGPAEVLEAAIAALPHRRLQVELQPERVTVLIDGVSPSNRVAGWSLIQAQRWLAEGGGPGLAGARLRVAAKVVGALGYSFTAPPDKEEATVTIHLARQER